MFHFIKRLVNGALEPFQLEIRRVEEGHRADPFRVQSQLVTKRDPVIFDVGANEGHTFQRYVQLFPFCTIHAFEPFPGTFKIMENRFGTHPAARLNQAAICDREGTVSLNANKVSDTNSILPTDARSKEIWGLTHFETQSVLQVPSTMIDVYCQAKGIETIDILKIDIQGAEMQALRGARRMLESGQIGLVYMEVIFVPTYQQQASFEEYLHYMDSVGYKLLDMYNLARKNLFLMQADTIWIKK